MATEETRSDQMLHRHRFGGLTHRHERGESEHCHSSQYDRGGHGPVEWWENQHGQRTPGPQVFPGPGAEERRDR